MSVLFTAESTASKTLLVRNIHLTWVEQIAIGLSEHAGLLGSARLTPEGSFHLTQLPFRPYYVSQSVRLIKKNYNDMYKGCPKNPATVHVTRMATRLDYFPDSPGPSNSRPPQSHKAIMFL